MIFQHTWTSIINNDKTATRRIVKPNEKAIRGTHNQIWCVDHNSRTKRAIGKTYAVQTGRGKPAIARIKLVRIRSEIAERISTEDAIAEGFENRRAFFATWHEIHGPNARQKRVWVLEFELVPTT